jgi:COP9 signalosome complex subunit 7
LNPEQQHKLALLTLISLAGEAIPLTYDYVISALSLPSASSLEALITEAIYNGLVSGRLSPTSIPPMVHFTSVAPLRDLRPTRLSDVLKVLQVWENRCKGVVDNIEGQIVQIRHQATKRKESETRRREIIAHAVLNTDTAGDGNVNTGGISVVGRPTRSPWTKAAGTNDDYRGKGKGIGNKRDLDEQQEDEESTQWAQHGGEEDDGVGVGLAKMEVDESAGVAGRGTDAGRTAKRAAGKKGI